jgi:peptidoglycan/LPS O-acetylase OafA/YrhL
MATGEIRAMTGVRGAAAVFVMIYHFEIDHIPLSGSLPTLLSHGYLAVDLFFVLSGFVMAHVYGSSFLNGQFRYGEFLWHRLARIYPLYITMTLAFLALEIAKTWHAGFGPYTLVSNLVMMQVLGNWPSIDPPAWSVSAEMVAYLLFPLIALLCLASSRVTALLLASAALVSILTLVLSASHHYIGSDIAKGPLDLFFAPFTAIRCLVGFTLGQVVWRFHKQPAVMSLTSRSSVQIAVASLALIALTRPGSDFLVYGLIVLLILCLGTDRGAVSHFFASRPLHFLGTISFAIYLVHYRALGAWAAVDHKLDHLGLLTGHLAATLVAGLVVVGVSWLLHVMVEKPCRQWMRRGVPIFARKTAGSL